LVAWTVRFERAAAKDSSRLSEAGLESRAEAVLALIEQDPYRVPPPCEKLLGDLKGFFSRRINRKHRVVYKVVADSHEVVIRRMFSHYGE
jgi:toxin YoeB